MSDTIDAVVVGAYMGRGRRATTYGTLLCAVRDPNAGSFKTVCKLGSGFTDSNLAELIPKFEDTIITSKSALVDSIIKPEPDIWFEPKFVIEIEGDELTLSPTHTAGFGTVRKDSGLAIRFPRFKNWREDKSVEDITTTDELIDMYNQQLKKVKR